MRAFVSPLIVILALVPVTGCGLFKKDRNSSSSGGGLFQNGPFSNIGKGAPKAPANNDPLLQNQVPPPPFPTQPHVQVGFNSAILAGRVVDGNDRPASNAFVQWTCLEDGKQSGAPIDVAVSADGYFVIQGLKPGATYKLIARAKQGEKLLAGTTSAQAPHIRLVLHVREDLVTPTTPPMPGSAGFQPEQKTSSLQGNDRPTIGLDPPAPIAQASLPTPIPAVSVPAIPPPAPSAAAFAPNAGRWTAPNQAVRDKTALAPLLSVPNPNMPTLNPAIPTDQASAPLPVIGTPLNTGPTRVPSCVVVGNRVVNLALNDVSGRPWEMRLNRQGKLLLLDFWACSCIPCKESMPFLSQLQRNYGSLGLEILGVACEEGTLNQQIERVNKTCHAHGANYRQLLADPTRGDVLRQFNIQAFPTLLLIDQNGVIIRRFDHGLGGGQKQLLEREIQNQLQNRAF